MDAAFRAHDLSTLRTLHTDRLDHADRNPDSYEAAEAHMHAAGLLATLLIQLNPGHAQIREVTAVLERAFERAMAWTKDEAKTAGSGLPSPRSLATWLGPHYAMLLLADLDQPRRALDVVHDLLLFQHNPNELVLRINAAECQMRLHRFQDAAAELTACEPLRWRDAARTDKDPDAEVMIEACAADLDMQLGNYDEALRRLEPLARVLHDLSPLHAVRLGRVYADCLLVTERFDEVGAWIEKVRGRPGYLAGTRDDAALGQYVASGTVLGKDADPAAFARAMAVLRLVAKDSGLGHERLMAGIHIARAALDRGLRADAQAAIDQAEQELSMQEAAGVASRSSPKGQRITSLASELMLARLHGGDPIDGATLRRQAERQGAALQAMLQDWRTAPRRPGGVGFLHFGFRRQVLFQRVALLLLEPGEQGRGRALEELLRAQGHGSLSRAAEAEPEPIDLATLRRELLQSSDHGLLVYLPGGANSHLFAVDRERIEYEQLPGAAALHGKMNALTEAMCEALWPEAATGDVEGAARARCESLARVQRASQALGAALLPPSMQELLAGGRR